MSKDLETSALDVRDDADGVRWITFDRPEAANAVTPADMRHMVEMFTPGREMPAAVVFTGTGTRCFSAGMHLRAISHMDPATARSFITMNRDLLALIRTAPFPTVAAVNGHCMAAGFGISLVCDVRIASENATFGLPEIRVGVPSVCDIALLQQFVGLGKAKEMILTGDRYPAHDLPGLVNVLVPPGELIPATRRMLSRLTGHTRTVMSAQKRLFEAWQNMPHAAATDMSIEVFAGVFASEETTEQARRHHESLRTAPAG